MLGDGGMGQVRERDQRLVRDAAIKFLPGHSWTSVANGLDRATESRDEPVGSRTYELEKTLATI
jgi:hypothetical protein